MFPEKNAVDLVTAVSNENLFNNLIHQLNKDFQLANINVKFSESISSKELIDELSKAIFYLLKNEYDSYLNLIYRIDVSERELLTLDLNSEDIISDITFLVLKREAQKVWFKSKF